MFSRCPLYKEIFIWVLYDNIRTLYGTIDMCMVQIISHHKYYLSGHCITLSSSCVAQSGHCIALFYLGFIIFKPLYLSFDLYIEKHLGTWYNSSWYNCNKAHGGHAVPWLCNTSIYIKNKIWDRDCGETLLLYIYSWIMSSKAYLHISNGAVHGL